MKGRLLRLLAGAAPLILAACEDQPRHQDNVAMLQASFRTAQAGIGSRSAEALAAGLAYPMVCILVLLTTAAVVSGFSVRRVPAGLATLAGSVAGMRAFDAATADMSGFTGVHDATALFGTAAVYLLVCGLAPALVAALACLFVLDRMARDALLRRDLVRIGGLPPALQQVVDTYRSALPPRLRRLVERRGEIPRRTLERLVMRADQTTRTAICRQEARLEEEQRTMAAQAAAAERMLRERLTPEQRAVLEMKLRAEAAAKGGRFRV